MLDRPPYGERFYSVAPGRLAAITFRPAHPFSRADWGFVLAGYADTLVAYH